MPICDISRAGKVDKQGFQILQDLMKILVS